MGTAPAPGLPPGANPGPAGLRVVTWNLHGLRDDTVAATDALRELRPDVLCMQEAPRFVGWRRRLDAFAASAGLRLVAGGGGGGRGTAVLVAPHVAVVGQPSGGQQWASARPAGTLPLSHDTGLHHRAVAIARLRLPARPPVEVTVAAVHLGLQQEQRLRHVDELLAALPLDGAAAVVVAGDLNETADRPAWRRLATRLTDLGDGGSPTFPARRPRPRIDTVLVDRLPAASDHLPAVADLLVGER